MTNNKSVLAWLDEMKELVTPMRSSGSTALRRS